MVAHTIAFWLLVSTFSIRTFAAYTLAQDYTGANFYSGFDFFTGADPTDGHVQFLSKSAANNSRLAGIVGNGASQGAVYLGSDSTSVTPNGRGSTRVSSAQAYQHALVIADISHMPAGCGTWPAFWTLGSGTWPANGEIDILEGVNAQSGNRYTLHTNANTLVQNSSFSGQLLTSNCNINAAGQAKNAGCSISDASPANFGADFNNATGGVYAMEWTSQAIKIWFFQRTSIPTDITSGQPAPGDSWGTPNAAFQGFNIDDYFNNHSIIFDTTFCGQWAGDDWTTSSCASLAPTCNAYVSNNPSAFSEAYWAINSLQVFQDSQQNSTQKNKSRRRMGGSVLG